MSRRRSTRTRATKKPVVVVAGEDRNDRTSLRVLLEAICPDMQGRIIEISDDVRLRRASGTNLATRVATLARKIRGRAIRENADVACVFIHEDLDGVDDDDYPPTHERVQKALEAELGTAHYVLAVAELEAWLLLWPDALADFVGSWRVPARHRGRDTGKLGDPKSILMREVSGSNRRYRETDAPGVLDKVLSAGRLEQPVGTNRSWSRFRNDATSCCTNHLRKAGQQR